MAMRKPGYPATELVKELPKVESGPAAGGALVFSLTTGDVFTIGVTDYVVTRLVAVKGEPLQMVAERVDGSGGPRLFRKGGTWTRAALGGNG